MTNAIQGQKQTIALWYQEMLEHFPSATSKHLYEFVTIDEIWIYQFDLCIIKKFPYGCLEENKKYRHGSVPFGLLVQNLCETHTAIWYREIYLS